MNRRPSNREMHSLEVASKTQDTGLAMKMMGVEGSKKVEERLAWLVRCWPGPVTE